MAKAAIVTLADEVADILNKRAGGWSLSFAAERLYLPVHQLEQTDTLKATVMLSAWRVSTDNRTDWLHEFDIDIGFQYRPHANAGAQAKAKFDEVLLLAEEVTDYFEDNRPPIANCPLSDIQFGGPSGAPYVPEHIEKFNQITTVIRLTYQKWRDPDA
jgi:hypothetical protein